MAFPPKKRKNGILKGVFREIFVSASQEAAAFGTVFVFYPENFEQQKLGTFFGVIKIDDSPSDSSYVVNLLTSVLKKEYFSSPERPADVSFEASLRKANLALAELARQGSVKWTGKINFVGGVLEKNNLHFSKLGTTAVLLFRKGQVADIGEGMGIEPEAAELHPLKTFTDISSGKIEKGDCLIFSTNDLLEIFSLEELKQNVSRFSRDEFPEILSASLSANSDLSGAIVVNLLSEEEALANSEKMKEKKLDFQPEPAPPEILPEKKIAPPRKSAYDILAPKEPPDLKTEKAGHLFTSDSEELPRRKNFAAKIFPALEKTAVGAKNASAGIWKKIFSSFRKIDWQKIFRLFKSAFLFFAEKFGRIDWKNRKTRIGLGVFILILLAGYSLFLLFGKKNDSAPPVETAPQSIAAPAPLNDKEVKPLENIEEVASLSSGSQEFVLMNGNLYVLSGEKSIMKTDPSNGATESFEFSAETGKFELITAMPDLQTIFILTENKKIVSFTPSNKKFQENSISLPGNLNATDIKTFLTYLYILDSSASQIYRFPRAEGGFGERQNWLKAGEDVKGATSFAINEDLFVSSRNQITAYLQGKKDDKVNFEAPDVSLAVDKVYTEPDFENIYVLDNKNRRIAAYSKEGKIVSQYWNTSLSGVKDFAVDEKNKTVYLLKTNSISKFPME
jgi:hypothetical protein